MDTERLRILKSRAKVLEPMVRIGKNGLTDGVVNQVKLLINRRRLVKVKFLRSFLDSTDRVDAARELASRTGALLVENVGFTVVLFKRGSPMPDKSRYRQ